MALSNLPPSWALVGKEPPSPRVDRPPPHLDAEWLLTLVLPDQGRWGAGHGLVALEA